MFLTQVNLQGFVFLHLFLEIHTRSRGDTWSTKGSFEVNMKQNKPKGYSLLQFLGVFRAIFWNFQVILGSNMYFYLYVC